MKEQKVDGLAPAESLSEITLRKRILAAYMKWVPLDEVDDNLNGSTQKAFDAGYRAALAREVSQ